MHRGAVIIKLQRDADDVIALAFQQTRDHGGIDATGHGDDDAGIFRLLVKIERVHGRLGKSKGCSAQSPGSFGRDGAACGQAKTRFRRYC